MSEQSQGVIIIKNFYTIEEKPRVNKLRLKKLPDGKIFITINNGKFKDGTERYSSFMLTDENKNILKDWLDSA